MEKLFIFAVIWIKQLNDLDYEKVFFVYDWH